VTTKDKVFQPSTPFRHAAENLNLLQDVCQPIMVQYTDGGPDHRCTYASVQLASLAMFVSLDLDMFVLARTAPNASWVNPAERCNSLLNLALQNVALERKEMEEELEKIVKHKNTMQAVRSAAETNGVLNSGLLDSIKPVIELVNGRYKHMRLKESPVEVHTPASDDQIAKLFKSVNDALCGGKLEMDRLCQTDIQYSPELIEFMERHCVAHHYMFQVKKCNDQQRDSCDHCQLHPPRLPEDVFSKLHCVPVLPLILKMESHDFCHLTKGMVKRPTMVIDQV
jgi:hypothetical protein